MENTKHMRILGGHIWTVTSAYAALADKILFCHLHN